MLLAVRGVKKQLLENSLDAFVLSLETVNRLSVRYRLESFMILLCNSWELLLKARIVDLHGRRAIYLPQQRGEKKRTLSGKICASKVFPNENNSMRRNLELVLDLRDESVHLVIANLPSDILELLQSCVLNYHKCLGEWFGWSLSDRVPLGMMSIIYDLAPLQRDIAILRKELGADEIRTITEFQSIIRAEAEELGHPIEYMARVDHAVVLVNRKGQADVQLTKGSDGTPMHIVEKPRDPATTHPLRTMALVNMIRSQVDLPRRFNQFCFQSICHVWNVKQRNDWYYCSAIEHSTPQYSVSLAERIISEIEKNPNFVEECREEFSRYRSKGG